MQASCLGLRLLPAARHRRFDLTGRADVGDQKLQEIASAKIAVDGHVELGEVPNVVRDLEPGKDCLDMLRAQRALLNHDAALVPRRMTSADRGHIGDEHGSSSDPRRSTS